MYKWISIIVFVSCLTASQVSVAQTSLKSSSQIYIPKGYSLVETPPIFESVSIPVLEKATSIHIPPTYKTTIEDGVRIRKEIVPAGKTEGLIFGPYKTQSVRKAVQPMGYALKNETGDIIKTWKWSGGKLITAQ